MNLILKMTTNKKESSYEERISALEQTLSELESGDVPLDQLVEKFEQAAGLLQSCQETLQKAEIRISQISLGPDGKTQEAPFIDKESI